jgi:hypothetical protein
MAKQVTFNPNPRQKPDPADLDAFVMGREGQGHRPASEPLPAPEPPAPKVPMKRLTFDIDAALHRRIRISCVERGIDMAEDLRRILADHFPPKS